MNGDQEKRQFNYPKREELIEEIKEFGDQIEHVSLNLIKCDFNANEKDVQKTFPEYKFLKIKNYNPGSFQIVLPMKIDAINFIRNCFDRKILARRFFIKLGRQHKELIEDWACVGQNSNKFYQKKKPYQKDHRENKQHREHRQNKGHKDNREHREKKQFKDTKQEQNMKEVKADIQLKQQKIVEVQKKPQVKKQVKKQEKKEERKQEKKEEKKPKEEKKQKETKDDHKQDRKEKNQKNSKKGEKAEENKSTQQVVQKQEDDGWIQVPIKKKKK